MKARWYHLMLYVSNYRRSFAFYHAFFKFVGWRLTAKWPDGAGWTDGRTQLWIWKAAASHRRRAHHRKGVGMNHFTLSVSSQRDVDRFADAFLAPRKIRPLYGSPKRWPYGKTYYALFFEDPDRMKIEVVYARPR